MEARRSGRGAGAWTKFRLLTWKNFLQQLRHPIQTVLELLLPVATMCLVLLLRWQIEPEIRPISTFTPFPAHSIDLDNTSILVYTELNHRELSIAYSPKSEALDDVIRSAVVNLLIRNVADIIKDNVDFPEINLPPGIVIPDHGNLTSTILEIIKSLIRVDSYNTSADLRSIYDDERTTRSVIAAVEFEDRLLGAAQLPSNITYSLRFPARSRINQFFGLGSRTWRTDLLFPIFELPGPRSYNRNGGRDPGYVPEMFIALQHMISTTLVSKLTGESALMSFNVNLQRYPHPSFMYDLVVDALQMLFPTFILLSFSYAAVNITRAVTVEKELQIKETLKIMGMPTWIHWTAWFCKQFIYLFIAAVLILIILKVNWFTNEDGYSDYAVFTNTPWSVLLFFLLLYLACMIFFCFMLSSFFSKGSTASLFAGIVWYMTYIPAFMLAMDIDMSIPVQILTCLSINSAMSYGFQLMLARESTGGMQWGEFMSSPTMDTSRLLFGHVVIMLVVNCVIYMLVALYFEQVLPGPYGTPKKWYFLFQIEFWFRNRKFKSDADVIIPETPQITKELDPLDHAVGVEITNLTKVFGNNVAVNNLSLNIYDDQITVLLGHNGAGKSTTISMLTGNLPVTSGSIMVAGYDMAWHTSEARRHIGLCPQHNVLFNELTVKEHLEFFSRLKGYQGETLREEVDSLIAKLELQEKRNYQAQGLSGGQKRRLCVGIALCGDARVVLLDEPTSGMDPSSRRALWDLLQEEKKGRSMILTTHFMDEADILGDRIAIMANGQLQCVGSPYFLKKHYGIGYSLVIVKDEGFNEEACTKLINKYIPMAMIKEDRGSEVTYNLKNEYSHIFEQMLNDLENNVEVVKFKNYGLLATTLEDVFMTVGSDVPTEADDADTTVDSISEETKYDIDASSIDRLRDEESISGFPLLCQQVLATWLKLWLVWSRSWGMVLLQILVPTLLITSTLGVMRYITSFTPTIVRRPLSLTEGYMSTESLLSFNGTSTSSLGALAFSAYEYFINSLNANAQITIVNETVDEHYLKIGKDPIAMGQIRHRVLTGASFSDNSATAWFSNFGYHDIATSLANVHTALLKSRLPDAQINVFNHPLEVNYSDQTDMQVMVQMMSMQLAVGIGSSLGIASAVFVMFYIKERVSRAKLLQKAAGIQPVVMWGSAAVFDWAWFLIIGVTVVISCVAFDVAGLSTVDELGRMYLCLMIYGAAMVPLNYLYTQYFNGPALGFTVVFFVNVLLGMMGPQIVDALSHPELTTQNVAEILDYVLQFFPLYSLVSAIRLLNHHGMRVASCMHICELRSLNSTQCSMEILCNTIYFCCVEEDPFFKWDDGGILRFITVMIISCAVLWIVFLMIEYRQFQKIFTRKRTPPPVDQSSVDEDVLQESKHADNLDVRALGEHSLVARGLSKYYGKHLAVNQISFTVNDSECFGLLGVNGAGKTTTFKMLMGDESISSGDAHVSGYSVRSQLPKVYENIGYCPQFDAVFDELTGRETLLLFGLLRGLRSHHSRARIEALAHALGFTKHLDKRVHQYSGGNKRKLSTAVALLGRTRLVFVDEPTTGVDPAAKRQVWRAIRGAQRAGRGVVLTSHSMEECEALCSRLTIMVNGRFQCLGTPQHLKNKFSEGFTLTIKIRMGMQRQLSSAGETLATVDTVKRYVETNFSNPTLMEEYQGLLTYYLPDRSLAWSNMFGIMERAKRDINVEDYSISQTTLEQIFLQFTKYQQESILNNK
ncbi:unnamed protein product [Chilo suppressalis]|uniref:ABC transporter domain-containing protein n=1 Tax=Chilo suppressalis TaxID=168631 RepID=A0ABN8AVH4_CHISP|nr:unnamed protein product [Chilo suppressalis]